ncbi:protein phosphatase 1 regulatory subunit 14A isoform X2 [Choloepus didactylus]|uniref:protein phosphatase 1 regulatory subunit 14A isoform X2 n=1 Tax=Choloepus didactylus TaxID=27675 RepID=UPI00189EEC29|nr:protein phosphatase 1 regulatory subunit 14A isoform X2 [Choloepus didactylus]
MAARRLGKRVLSKLQAPSRARGPEGSPGGLQKRHSRVTVKYDRRELQRRLDVEKWIDGRLEELYRGRSRPARPRSPPLDKGRKGEGTLTPSLPLPRRQTCLMRST